MVVPSLLRVVLAAAVVALFAPAQGAGPGPLTLGSKAPVASWRAWPKGEPIELGAENAPACVVFAFYTSGQELWREADGDYLGDLQKRFAERGVRFVAVVGDEKTPMGAGWAPCSIAVDKDLATTRAWFGDEGLSGGNIVVLDRGAQAVFVGRPESGLYDAVQRVLDGRTEVDKEIEATMVRFDLLANFDTSLGDASKASIERLLLQAPHDGLLLGLLYLVEAQKRIDPDAARTAHKLAVDRLANEARPLAAFADLALRGDGRAVGLAVDLAAALVPATATCPNDVFVQLAYLRALVLAGKSREVGRHAARIRKLALTAPAQCLEFAEILTQDATPAVHRDLAQQATLKAEQLGADPRLLAATKYLVALRCAEDPVAAKDGLGRYLENVTQRVSINNDCWYFLTDLPTMGRFDRFGLALAERMLEERKDMDGMEFDTAALAMFVSGRLRDAVELQELAIEKGGRGNPEYAERLRRYKTAADAAGK